MYCSNCGQELAPEAKFCSNCGAPVEPGASSVSSSESERERERREDFEKAWGSSASSTSGSRQSESKDAEPASSPAADRESFSEGFSDRKATWEIEREKMRDQADDEWSMSDLGPVRPQRRRTWLWVLLGVIAFVVISCCVFMWWITATESGTEWFEGIATQAAEEIVRATEAAATPEP